MVNVVAPDSVCATCGEPLKGKTGCLACLLRGGLDEPGEAGTREDATSFGDFEIERRDDGSLCELGRGAMGITYRAVDKVLHRKVALKVIEPPAAAGDSQTLRERFMREARAAAALRHPNVAGVFRFSASPELNRCYCAMELVEGETLEALVRRDGPIGLQLALEIAIQVTRALMAAAERGLIHRDLKPGNIMLARSDDPARPEVKVIDFGLAKVVSNAGDMELTHGGFVGTPAFASPEQFAGGTVDARSDIYALGVTLWFALTGRLPSAGTTIEEIRQRQAHHKLPLEQLQSKAVPQPLIELLQSCLAIEPTERPTSARELMRALEACRDQIARKQRSKTVTILALAAAVIVSAVVAWSVVVLRKSPASGSPGAMSRPIEKGIAVLPFENLSNDKADTFFADGIQEDVLTTLGKIKDFKVIARGSVTDYRDARGGGKVREIGRALGVSHVVQGSVRRGADRVVVNVALIHTPDERQLWAERYERSLTDAVSLQGELALEIARALRTTLTPFQTTIAVSRPTENADAYLLYLRGREAQGRSRNSGEWDSALQLYEQAVELDPNFALARARLAISSAEASRWPDRPDLREKSRLHAMEALRLRPDLAEARLAMAYVYVFLDENNERALAEVARAQELAPNSAEVHLTAAFIHKKQNNYRERIAALQRAEALDPRSARIHLFLALTHRWVRDWPAAIGALDRRAVMSEEDRQNPDRVQWTRGNDEFRMTGDVAALKRPIAEAERDKPTADWLNAARYETAMLERDYAAAAGFLAQLSPADLHAAVLPNAVPHLKTFHEALLHVARGSDMADQQAALEAAARELVPIASAPSADGGAIRRDNAATDLAIVYALLGRKDEAIAEAQRAIQIPPGAPDTIEKKDLAAGLALVYAHTGESEKALDLIEHLLTVPISLQRGAIYNMTQVDLKWRWVWDPLRSHPRFQKLLAGPEPKTNY